LDDPSQQSANVQLEPHGRGPGGHSEFLAPLVSQWIEKIGFAQDAKKPFNTIAQQCDQFFSQSSGFMWKDKFRKKHLGEGIKAPRFQVTMNKAFELVALFGPYLFWKYPGVWVQSYDQLELKPELFGIDDSVLAQVQSGDPNAMQQIPPEQQMAALEFQQAVSEQQQEKVRRDTRNSLMMKYLNYSQREQPGDGLAMSAELAITEALVKGRGVLWPEAYTFPGSGRTMTGRFWGTVDDLFVDPDCTDPTFRDAKWIARRHCNPDWEVERKFGLASGTLANAGAYESVDSLSSNRSDSAKQARKSGKTHDLVVWYEIWSKCGVGTRMSHSDDADAKMIGDGLHSAFDEVVGDFAYLCVVDGVSFPLNAPASKIRSTHPDIPDASDEEVQALFEWRAPNYGPLFPCYLDDRWPVACLDFYRDPKSAWPIAPLAPGLGELISLNILISAAVENAFEGRKQIIAYLESAAADVRGKVDSSQSPVLIPLKDTVAKSINEVIQYLNKPGMNKDIWDAINMVSQMFDKRTGLTEFMYAVSGTQSRSARDVAAKEEKAAIRPEKMSEDVAKWMTASANLEKFLAGWTVEGYDLAPLLGRHGAHFWDQLIAGDDPEVFVREMQATVESSELRKPNRDRLMSNLQEMMQYMLPVLQGYAQTTGNTEPLNAFLEKMGTAMEQDVAGWRFGPWAPEPDPQMQQMQQMQMQLDQAKQEAEVQSKQIDAQKAQVELQKAQVETQRASIEAENQIGANQVEVESKQLEFLFDQAKHDQELEQDDEFHQQELSQKREEGLMGLMQRRAEGQLKIAQMRNEAVIKAADQTPDNV
jgi:hypothetical protein